MQDICESLISNMIFELLNIPNSHNCRLQKNYFAETLYYYNNYIHSYDSYLNDVSAYYRSNKNCLRTPCGFKTQIWKTLNRRHCIRERCY